MKDTDIASIITDESFLRQVSRPTSLKEVEKKNIVPLIKEALKTAWCQGYGLAAVQIGIPVRATWFCLRNKKGELVETTLINPVIKEKHDEIVVPGEGCLSIPNKFFNTVRYKEIVFESNGREYVAEGREAQIIQHEVDHCNGILIYDRVYKTLPGRNDFCSCGSGKKYKKCCGR